MNGVSTQRQLPVALLVETSRAYGRGILRGIAAYAQTHGMWPLYHSERALGDRAPEWIRACKPRGIIARLENEQLIRLIQKMNVPTVDLRGLRTLEKIPLIRPNQRAIAQLAAGHLMERGFLSFACCCFAGVNYAEDRIAHFADYVRSCGYPCETLQYARRSHASMTVAIEEHGVVSQRALEAWLKSLPKPVGLMAANDVLAQLVLACCSDCGIAAPEEIAVVGVDNDEVICDLCRPSLSSVEPDTRKMGYEAAALLDRMMAGEPPPTEPILIDPLGVAERQSTDVLAVPDSDVASALRYIREHACDGIRVSDVSSHVCLSHSTLKRKFARLMKRSPKTEILRVQINGVKRLLAMTEYPLEEIAHRTGFSYVENMCTVFRKKTGQTPSEYRRKVKMPVAGDQSSRQPGRARSR